MKHLSRKEITELVIEKRAGKAQKEQMDHLFQCAQCSTLYKKVQKIYTALPNDLVSVPGNIEKRVLDTYRSKSAGEIDKTAAVRPRITVLKPLIAAASVIIIISAGLFMNRFMTLENSQITQKSPLAFSILTTGVSINDTNAPLSGVLSEGDRILTHPEGSTTIEKEGLFTVKINTGSSIMINTARTNKAGDSFRHAFSFQQGSLIARFNKSTAKNDYSFITPHARLDSIGTVFMLAVNEQKTSLSLTSGECRLTSLRTGESIICKAGNRYDISTKLQIAKMDDKTIESIEDMQFPESGQENAPQGTSLTKKPEKNLGDHNKTRIHNREPMKELKNNSRELRNSTREQREQSGDRLRESRQLRNQQRERGRR